LFAKPLESLPEILTAREVAKLLRVSPMTVYRLIGEGEISSIRVGRSFRIHRDAFVAFINAQNQQLG
jgi:excisionase family DNA binding protein